MAVDMFLKIDGLEGESQDKDHGKEMDILAWSWGSSSSGTMHVGGGGGAGKAAVQDVGITKYVDKASKGLLEYCVTGKHFGKGQLTVRKAGGTPLEYIKIEFEELLITSVSTGGSGGEDRLTITAYFADPAAAALSPVKRTVASDPGAARAAEPSASGMFTMPSMRLDSSSDSSMFE